MGSPTVDGNSTAAAAMPHYFCNSAMSTTMYMDGFRSTLFAYLFTPPPTGGGGDDSGMDDDNNAPPCLNFLRKRWVLDTPTKFVGAMIFIVLLGIAAEGMAAARSGGWVQRLAHKLAQRCCCCCWSWSCCSTNSRFGGDGGGRTSAHRRRRRRQSSQCQRHIVKLCTVATHMVQALVGYILMLAAMSYSLELLGSVLLGLGVGYATFFDLDYMYEGNGDDEVGREEEGDQDEDPANVDGTTTITNPGSGNGRNGNPSGTSISTCCDVAGRGPPRRRAFQFLRSPVPTLLAGVGGSHRRMSPREGGGTSDGNDGDADADEADAAMAALHGGRHGDGADNVSLHEDDKMTPLL